MAEKPSVQDAKQFPFVPIFIGFWVVLLIIAAVVSRMDATVLTVIIVAAAISGVLLALQLLQEWDGTVEEIKTIAETRKQGKRYVKENVTYAFVRLASGKLRKERSGGWKTGDRLRKVRGELNVRVVQ